MCTYLLMLMAMMFTKEAKHDIMQKAPMKIQRAFRSSNHISPSTMPESENKIAVCK